MCGRGRRRVRGRSWVEKLEQAREAEHESRGAGGQVGKGDEKIGESEVFVAKEDWRGGGKIRGRRSWRIVST